MGQDDERAWRPNIVGLGELLWDVLPGGRQIGGAPANFAYCSHLLGDNGIIASRIGDDELGREMQKTLQDRGLSTKYLQFDSSRPTGTAHVALNDDGQPTFNIEMPSAWDSLENTHEWAELAKSADAICFGTLAQRSPASRKTILEFLDETNPGAIRIFDLNLRGSFYSIEIVETSLARANVLKLNDGELPIAAALLGLHASNPPVFCRQMLDKFSLNLIAVTFGSRGSLLVNGSDVHHHPGFPVKVQDTVGAGDAFTAGLARALLRGGSLAAMNESANRMGAWVASQRGAMPTAPDGGLQAALNALISER
jgi:fructokinase